MKDGCLKDVEV